MTPTTHLQEPPTPYAAVEKPKEHLERRAGRLVFMVMRYFLLSLLGYRLRLGYLDIE
jgi:hypothetical protein